MKNKTETFAKILNIAIIAIFFVLGMLKCDADLQNKEYHDVKAETWK